MLNLCKVSFLHRVQLGVDLICLMAFGCFLSDHQVDFETCKLCICCWPYLFTCGTYMLQWVRDGQALQSCFQCVIVQHGLVMFSSTVKLVQELTQYCLAAVAYWSHQTEHTGKSSVCSSRFGPSLGASPQNNRNMR